MPCDCLAGSLAEGGLAAVRQLRWGGARRQPGSSAPGVQFLSPPVLPSAAEALAAVQQLRRGSSAGVRQLSSGCSIPFSSMSRFNMGFRESKPKFLPPILLNHGRDNPHYESLLVVEVPETPDAVFMIHNIIRGAHSFWC